MGLSHVEQLYFMHGVRRVRSGEVLRVWAIVSTPYAVVF